MSDSGREWYGSFDSYLWFMVVMIYECDGFDFNLNLYGYEWYSGSLIGFNDVLEGWNRYMKLK